MPRHICCQLPPICIIFYHVERFLMVFNDMWLKTCNPKLEILKDIVHSVVFKMSRLELIENIAKQ